MSGWTRTGFIIGIGMVVTWVCRLIGVTSEQSWPVALMGTTGLLLVYACGWHAYDRYTASTAGREVSGE